MKLDSKSWDFDELPQHVQQALENTPDGEYCEFSLEDEDGRWHQYRLRKVSEKVISKEQYDLFCRG
jgi:hypothetical protein